MKGRRNAAGSAPAPGRPRKWDAAVSSAYLRALGATQARAAKAAGVSERTLRGWECATWWPDALREARDRWLRGIEASARSTLTRELQKDGALALRVLERLDPAFLPPRLQVDVAHIDYTELTDEQLSQIAAGASPAAVIAGRSRRG